MVELLDNSAAEVDAPLVGQDVEIDDDVRELEGQRLARFIYGVVAAANLLGQVRVLAELAEYSFESLGLRPVGAVRFAVGEFAVSVAKEWYPGHVRPAQFSK